MASIELHARNIFLHYPHPDIRMRRVMAYHQFIVLTLGEVASKRAFEDPKSFLFMPAGSQRGAVQSAVRYELLSESLFVLRHSNGFDELIGRFIDKDIWATFYEAYCTAFCHRLGAVVEIKKEIGRCGSDFDFTAKFDDVHLNCKVFSIQCDSFNASTVINRLAEKRDQLPNDAPSAIFCSVPSKWIFTDENLRLLDNALRTFLRRTKRINFVQLLTETINVRYFPENVYWEPDLFIYKFQNRNPRIPVRGNLLERNLVNPADQVLLNRAARQGMSAYNEAEKKLAPRNKFDEWLDQHTS